MTAAFLAPDEDPPAVCADRVSRLTWPHGTTEDARVILTRRDLWVWLPAGEEPRLVLRVPWHPAASTVRPDGTGEWRIATGGGEYVARPGGGSCAACSSALARFVPFHPYRRAALPTTGSSL